MSPNKTIFGQKMGGKLGENPQFFGVHPHVRVRTFLRLLCGVRMRLQPKPENSIIGIFEIFEHPCSDIQRLAVL